MDAESIQTDRVESEQQALHEASIGWNDRSLLLTLLVVFVLQLLSWSGIEGYQLADSVEYMERAQALVRGEAVVDSVDIRGLGFTSLFTPLFALADFLSINDFRPIVGLARILQMLLGLELIRVTIMLGAKLGGRRAGLVAGLAVGFNPYFLLYSASPVSGIAAGVCVAHALYHLAFRSNLRQAFIGGLWLGGALLVAYKTILIALPILGLLFLSDRFKRWRSWIGASVGYAAGVLATFALDKLCYGVWGQSIELYIRQNFGHLATRLCLKLGLHDWATWCWEFTGGEMNSLVAAPSTVPSKLLKEPNPLYHLTHLNEMVVWPLLLLVLFGLGRVILRGDRASRLLTCVCFFSLAAVSLKKSNDFRLLLPILSCIGVLCGIGWQALFGERIKNKSIALTGVALVIVGGMLGWSRLGELNNTQFSGYWRAMNRVNQLAEASVQAGETDAKFRVACAWNWAVYLRQSEHVDLIKLPHQIDRWAAFDDEFKADNLDEITTLDIFITHLAVLLGSTDLFKAVNTEFEVDSVLYNRAAFQDLGPIIIFKRRTDSGSALTFQTRTTGVDPAAYIEDRELNTGLSFEGNSATPGLSLVGWKYEALRGDGHGWLSLHWLRVSDEPVSNFLVRPRILTPFTELPWEEQHRLGRGFLANDQWQVGEIISEGWPVVAAVSPFDASQPWRPLYPESKPGSLFPGSLWLRVTPVDQDGTPGQALTPLLTTQDAESHPISDSFVRVDKLKLYVPDE